MILPPPNPISEGSWVVVLLTLRFSTNAAIVIDDFELHNMTEKEMERERQAYDQSSEGLKWLDEKSTWWCRPSR